MAVSVALVSALIGRLNSFGSNERLMVAFYDHRKAPANESVPMAALVAGGNLAHYTGDAAMPLHTTRDYDGRFGKNPSWTPDMFVEAIYKSLSPKT